MTRGAYKKLLKHRPWSEHILMFNERHAFTGTERKETTINRHAPKGCLANSSIHTKKECQWLRDPHISNLAMKLEIFPLQIKARQTYHLGVRIRYRKIPHKP
jgi:hypothetical protein